MEKRICMLFLGIMLLFLAVCAPAAGSLQPGEVRALPLTEEEESLLALAGSGESTCGLYSCAWDGTSDQLKLEFLSRVDGEWVTVTDLAGVDYSGGKARETCRFGVVLTEDVLTVNLEDGYSVSIPLAGLRPELAETSDWATGRSWSEGGICQAGERRGAPVEIRIVTMAEFHKNGPFEPFLWNCAAAAARINRKAVYSVDISYDHAYAITAVFCGADE
ncbi:hypothetical protein [Pseudoflavonifractor sp. HCP28S3_F10]|uniref:hypothetical protein n=1 Tax=Pseudoflavonifractor sp. HCP28S3_F10 TaxID=3438947 RepID=UPI003F8B6EB9